MLLHSALIIIFVVSEKSQTKILLFFFEGISVGAEWCETVGTAHMEQGLVRARRLEAVHHQREGERHREFSRCTGTHTLNVALLTA